MMLCMHILIAVITGTDSPRIESTCVSHSPAAFSKPDSEYPGGDRSPPASRTNCEAINLYVLPPFSQDNPFMMSNKFWYASGDSDVKHNHPTYVSLPARGSARVPDPLAFTGPAETLSPTHLPPLPTFSINCCTVVFGGKFSTFKTGAWDLPPTLRQHFLQSTSSTGRVQLSIGTLTPHSHCHHALSKFPPYANDPVPRNRLASAL
mmetsp:Transcript_52233/g.138435  ORF Transcript_52233/g.138435 Transcript_52233/m.138435 type:complete len:206 (-) Transcript_52233:2030-2647(-)